MAANPQGEALCMIQRAACKSLSKVEFTPKLMKFSVYSSLFEGN
jgi:hypothetical protein